MSYTFVLLEISEVAYNEIAQKMKDAGYTHAFFDQIIDMHGIALAKQKDDVADADKTKKIHS